MILSPFFSWSKWFFFFWNCLASHHLKPIGLVLTEMINKTQNKVLTVSKRHIFRLKNKPLANGNESIQHPTMINGKYVCNILCLLSKTTIFIQVFKTLSLKKFWQRYMYFSIESNKFSIFQHSTFKEFKCVCQCAVKQISSLYKFKW